MLNTLVFAFIATVIHELGHYVTAKCFGLTVRKVGVNWRGFYTQRQAGTPYENMLISLGGPAYSLLAAVVFLPVGYKMLVVANVVFGLVNLLPLPYSDGSNFLNYYKQFKGAQD